MASGMTDLLLIGAVLGVGYYVYSSGFLSNIIPQGMMGGPPPGYFEEEYEEDAGDVFEQYASETEKGGKKKKKKKKESGPPPGYGGPPQYQGPPPYPTSAPPPGMQSSMLPMNVPYGPPYTTGSVGTYSQYSPYNQMSAYQEYRTPPRGTASTMADDNILFNDINTAKPGCYMCKTYCQSSPGSFQCATCRMPCKNIAHTFIPPSKGWTIAPAGFGIQPNYSYLGQVWDDLMGKGATFAEMDDYSQKKRFDCHNKLKRRVTGKDNSFVSQGDYYYDRNNINVALV